MKFLGNNFGLLIPTFLVTEKKPRVSGRIKSLLILTLLFPESIVVTNTDANADFNVLDLEFKGNVSQRTVLAGIATP